VAERILAYILQNTVISLFLTGKRHVLTLKMSILNRMLVIENLYLKFHILNSISCQWVHKINTERDIHGEFHHLYTELRGYP
jgi:hypothetical protein